MENSTLDLKQINDSFFHKVFDSPENSKDFLKKFVRVCLCLSVAKIYIVSKTVQ